VFCSDKGRASILVAGSSLANLDYRDCLQVGPILLRDGAVQPNLQSSSAAGSDYDKMIKGQVAQAMVCIDSAGRVLLGVTSNRVPLADMVTALQQPPINCANAIRLQPGGMQVNSDLFGVDNYLHPSALLVIK
jgi:hypothetical protein